MWCEELTNTHLSKVCSIILTKCERLTVHFLTTPSILKWSMKPCNEKKSKLFFNASFLRPLIKTTSIVY